MYVIVTPFCGFAYYVCVSLTLEHIHAQTNFTEVLGYLKIASVHVKSYIKGGHDNRVPFWGIFGLFIILRNGCMLVTKKQLWTAPPGVNGQHCHKNRMVGFLLWVIERYWRSSSIGSQIPGVKYN